MLRVLVDADNVLPRRVQPVLDLVALLGEQARVTASGRRAALERLRWPARAELLEHAGWQQADIALAGAYRAADEPLVLVTGDGDFGGCSPAGTPDPSSWSVVRRAGGYARAPRSSIPLPTASTRFAPGSTCTPTRSIADHRAAQVRVNDPVAVEWNPHDQEMIRPIIVRARLSIMTLCVRATHRSHHKVDSAQPSGRRPPM